MNGAGSAPASKQSYSATHLHDEHSSVQPSTILPLLHAEPRESVNVAEEVENSVVGDGESVGGDASNGSRLGEDVSTVDESVPLGVGSYPTGEDEELSLSDGERVARGFGRDLEMSTVERTEVSSVADQEVELHSRLENAIVQHAGRLEIVSAAEGRRNLLARHLETHHCPPQRLDRNA